MKKILILIAILLIGSLSANSVEQQIHGVLVNGLILPDQEVMIGECLDADFKEFSGTSQNSFVTNFSNVNCEFVGSFPEGLITYGNNSDCVVEWCSPDANQTGDYSIIIKTTLNNNSEYYYFNLKVYDYLLKLDKKWNLISIPLSTSSSNINEVFSDILEEIIEIWSYENGNWIYYIPEDNSSTLNSIVPGKGYWIKTNNSTEIFIVGNMSLPNNVSLRKGWNLIGHYGVVSKKASCALSSLADTIIGFPRWSALVSYNSSTKEFEYLNSTDYMDAGKGYWVEIDIEDNYSYSSTC